MFCHICEGPAVAQCTICKRYVCKSHHIFLDTKNVEPRFRDKLYSYHKEGDIWCSSCIGKIKCSKCNNKPVYYCFHCDKPLCSQHVAFHEYNFYRNEQYGEHNGWASVQNPYCIEHVIIPKQKEEDARQKKLKEDEALKNWQIKTKTRIDNGLCRKCGKSLSVFDMISAIFAESGDGEWCRKCRGHKYS